MLKRKVFDRLKKIKTESDKEMEPGVDMEPGLDIDLDSKILPESDISKNRARVQTKKTELGLEIGFDLLSEVR